MIDLALMLACGLVLGWLARGAADKRRRRHVCTPGPWAHWFTLGNALYQRRWCTRCLASEDRHAGVASLDEVRGEHGWLQTVSVAEQVH